MKTITLHITSSRSPKKVENLILWLSPLQNDKGSKMVTNLLYNGSGHYNRIASFDSRASHEIRFSTFLGDREQ